MHFHHAAICLNCHRVRLFTTPLPNIVVLSSLCENCGWFDYVGWEGDRTCTSCMRLHKQDVAREVGSDETISATHRDAHG